MGWFWGWILGLLVIASAVQAEASLLSPHLEANALASWVETLKGPFRGKDVEKLEMAYQTFIQPQTFRDLQAVYDPKNADKIQIVFPSFTSEGSKASPDLGYGLHVVKRLVLNLPDGSQKVIDVNEHWAENRSNQGLYLPDEIRIKTRVLDGERYMPGSERQYFFDSIRLAWDEGNQISIQRRSRFRERDGQINKLKQMRVAVSAPISCMACHDSGSTLPDKFLEEGERINREAVVQDSFFDKPYSEMFGYQEYLAHLKKKKAPAEFIARVILDLEDPKASFAVPGIFEALAKGITSYNWLGEDDEVRSGAYSNPIRQGVYRAKGKWYLDALEEIFEGKYRYWEPTTAIPRAGVKSCRYHVAKK